jgi:hypothetical protein
MAAIAKIVIFCDRSGRCNHGSAAAVSQTLPVSAVFFVLSALFGSVHAQPVSSPATAPGALKPFTRPPSAVNAPVEASRIPLGRVFFTPSERQSLDSGQPLNEGEGEDNRTDGNPASPRSLVLDGYLLRNGRLEAVWVNGLVPADNSDFTVTRAAKSGGVTLLDAQKKPLAEGLKPGQKANIDKREVLDPLPQGAIIKRTSR